MTTLCIADLPRAERSRLEVRRDAAIGRRLARGGMRISRSDRVPEPWERLARYYAVATGKRYALITAMRPGFVGSMPAPPREPGAHGRGPAAVNSDPCLPGSGQQAPIPAASAALAAQEDSP